jgi:hypothetical protein
MIEVFYSFATEHHIVSVKLYLLLKLKGAKKLVISARLAPEVEKVFWKTPTKLTVSKLADQHPYLPYFPHRN